MDARMLGVWLVGVLLGAGVEGGPFLEGKVVDEEGRPVAGASVKIYDTGHNCFGGKEAITDRQGRYVFVEKPFPGFPSGWITLPGRFVVSQQIDIPKLNAPDTRIARRADFVVGKPAEAEIHLEGGVPGGWTEEVAIRSRDESLGMTPRMKTYSEAGEYVAELDRWMFGSLPRGERLHLVVTRTPIFEKSDDVEVTRNRERERREREVKIVSPGIRLIDAQRYIVRAKVEEDSASGTLFVVVKSIKDALGTERLEELVVADPNFGPPADEAVRESALTLLKRVEAAAKPWNGRIPAEISSYEYDAIHLAEKMKTHVKVDQNSSFGPDSDDLARIRGAAYMPPLRWIFKQPENVVFHGVEMGEDRCVLHYRLKTRRGFEAGLGVGPTWNGSLMRDFSMGSIVIDPQTATVIEHRMSSEPAGPESVEQFSDYVPVGDGFAPQTLRLQSDGKDLLMTFQVHQGKLWLLSEGSWADRAKPGLTVENVVVNLETAAIEN